MSSLLEVWLLSFLQSGLRFLDHLMFYISLCHMSNCCFRIVVEFLSAVTLIIEQHECDDSTERRIAHMT